MRHLMHMLLILAVLWCGLHLSSAEADALGGHDPVELALHDHGDESGPGDRERPDLAHTCHSHCPLTAGGNAVAAIAPPVTNKEKSFIAPVKALISLSQAPPLEPPSA